MAKKGNSWINKQRNDKYYKKSKQENHRARSYYKLKQINEKYNIFQVNGRNSKRILDLGAAPGAWLEYIKDEFLKRPIDQQSKKFKAIGIDLTSIKPFEDVSFIETYRLDIFKEQCAKVIQENSPYDAIVSDLAPKTTGDFRDVAIQLSMVEKVFEIALKHLRRNGNVAIKVFQSEETNEILQKYKEHFSMLKRMKPQSSRDTSRELYIIGLKFKKF
ncbi:Ribosomal RNA large subunit methyltransferase E [Candidatus Lokiarchaeum ossiferum]|uniref:Ribosomal RNA large subunit methyltransferase E n=1 Tax=Candidatus Lokiarchaeum ossiferum TaxID=2951803 RepID=A0ABY6HV59_9ARCH|nr:Ribosomal RNA large subunit methyltransferase E [Candidatus Lokiarchaeum sp. B-35]